MNSIKCLNCQNNANGKFCSNCGQPLDFKPLNFKYLFHEIQHGIFHLDSGFIYTIKELFSRPGDTISEYIHGKRARHFKPLLSLVVLLATLYLLIVNFLKLEVPEIINLTVKGDQGLFNDILEVNKWIAHHFVWTTILSIPVFSVVTYLIFKKANYNFVEHIVLNTFLACQKLTVRLVFIPAKYFLIGSHSNETFNTILIVIDFLLLYWTYFVFFKQSNRLKSLGLTLLTYIVYNFLVALITLGIVAYIIVK